MIDDAAADSPHATEQDENYFVSMTDMMVGVLFIFIILLMVFALNFRTQTDVTEDQIKRLQDATRQAQAVASRLEELQASVRSELNALDEANRVRADLLEDLRKRLLEMGLVVEVDEINGVLRLTEDAIRFDVDSAVLNARATENVGKVATVLAAVLPTYTGGSERAAHVETVFVEGHTDVTGNDRTNWELSTARAVNTYAELTRAAPTLRALRNDDGKEILSVSGYASTRPVPRQPINNWAVHRRIDLRFVMAVDSRARLEEVLTLTGAMQDQLQALRTAIERAHVD